MTTLADPALERLCDLFASGHMEQAKEIAQLLAQEINEPRLGPEAQLSRDLLSRVALALQAQ
jgi:hypothetical protein